MISLDHRLLCSHFVHMPWHKSTAQHVLCVVHFCSRHLFLHHLHFALTLPATLSPTICVCVEALQFSSLYDMCVCARAKWVYVSSVWISQFNHILLQSAKRILRCWRYVKIHHIILRCTILLTLSISISIFIAFNAHIFIKGSDNGGSGGRGIGTDSSIPANFLLKQIDWTIGFIFFSFCYSFIHLFRSFYLKLLFTRLYSYT